MLFSEFHMCPIGLVLDTKIFFHWEHASTVLYLTNVLTIDTWLSVLYEMYASNGWHSLLFIRNNCVVKLGLLAPEFNKCGANQQI